MNTAKTAQELLLIFEDFPCCQALPIQWTCPSCGHQLYGIPEFSSLVQCRSCQNVIARHIPDVQDFISHEV